MNFQLLDGNNLKIRAVVEGEGPLVVLVHGWPESWYSWRHQIEPLSKAGFKVAAIDVRGYGGSDKPYDIAEYSLKNIAADIAGVIDSLGYKEAFLFGHDWGGPIVWTTGLLYQDMIKAVGALSVPYTPVGEKSLIQLFRELYKDKFFYQLYFQTPGIAEAELEADVRIALRKFYHMASGQMDIGLMIDKPADADLLSDLPDPEQLGAWMSDADLDFYVSEFSRSGFRGPLNYYRNHNLTWELTEGAPTQIQQPALFVAGDRDGVIAMAAQALENMPTYVTDLRVNALIPGIGHWTQQEAAEATNEYLLDWLASLD